MSADRRPKGQYDAAILAQVKDELASTTALLYSWTNPNRAHACVCGGCMAERYATYDQMGKSLESRKAVIDAHRTSGGASQL